MFAILPTPSESFLVDAPLAAVDTWVHSFDNLEPVRRPAELAHRLHVLVVMGGEVRIESARGTRFVTAGQVALIEADENVTLTFKALAESRGKVFGLSVLPFELSETFNAKVTVRDAGPVDAEPIVAQAREWAERLARGESLPAADVKAAVLDLLARNTSCERRDAIGEAKHEIDKQLSAALYVEHYALVAALPPVAFARQFAKRYGQPPVRYRVQRRVHEAARLLLLYPTRPVLHVGIEVGFLDFRFFKRAFRAQFGMSATDFRATHSQRRLAA